MQAKLASYGFFQMRKSKKILSKSKLSGYNYLLWPYHHEQNLSNGFHLDGYIQDFT